MTEFLNYDDFNVIRVNWFPGVIGTYGDATANSRIVGAEISFLIDRFRVCCISFMSKQLVTNGKDC